MADKLRQIREFPQKPDFGDDDLLLIQGNGTTYNVSGRAVKRYAENAAAPQVELAAKEAQAAADAADRGIENGQLAEIFNRRGTVCIPVRVTDRIAVGTVAMSEGAWYTPDGEGRDRRGCINVLTMSHRTTPLAHGNPQHTNLVQVRKFQATGP